MAGFVGLDPVRQLLDPLGGIWQDLAAEATRLGDEWIAHPDHHVSDTGWSIIPVRYFGHTDRLAAAQAPVLAEALRGRPEILTAAYMRLAPGVTLAAHHGNPIGIARCHLGLDIPDGCWIEVEGDRRTWVRGEWLAFDDTALHAAANEGTADRLILSIDVEHPEVPVTRWAVPVRRLSQSYYRSVRRFPQLEFLLGRLAPVSSAIRWAAGRTASIRTAARRTAASRGPAPRA